MTIDNRAAPVGGDTPRPQWIADILDEARSLRSDVHTAERARKRQNMISTAILAVLALFVAMALVLAWQGNRTIAETRRTNQAIADCTQPTGACYQTSKTRTGQAIAAILHAEVYMAECARQWPGESGPEFDRKLEACVAGKLAADAAASPAPSSSPRPSPGGK